MSTLLDRGGFKLTKWLSTSRKLLADLPPDRLGNPNLNMERDILPTEKTLGLHWDAERDVFVIKTGNPPTHLSQRILLSAINSIYDPLGFIQPVFLKAKRILQKSQIDWITWDDPLPKRLVERWLRWVDGLGHLSAITIPCCLQPNGIAADAQLHTFCDASEKGFGCVIYLRTTTPTEVAIAFVAGKAWAAPKKFQTIPKLELQAAVMGLRLTTVVKEDLKIEVGPPTFWSDSATVLGWVHSTSMRFQTFVGHRVGEILEGSTPSQWRHVPGILNPVDDASRGLHPHQLTSEHRWFTGPEFLRETETKWPTWKNLVPAAVIRRSKPAPPSTWPQSLKE